MSNRQIAGEPVAGKKATWNAEGVYLDGNHAYSLPG